MNEEKKLIFLFVHFLNFSIGKKLITKANELEKALRAARACAADAREDGNTNEDPVKKPLDFHRKIAKGTGRNPLRQIEESTWYKPPEFSYNFDQRRSRSKFGTVGKEALQEAFEKLMLDNEVPVDMCKIYLLDVSTGILA